MPSKRAAPTAPRHEVADVSGRRIVWTAAGLATMLVVVALAAWAVLSVLRSDSAQDASSPRVAAARMPAPRLQSAPSRELDALREEKRAMLSEYRWLDRGAGVVRIPIERSMELLAERSGAQARPAGSMPGGQR
jgi:hypothetical protein